MTIQDTLQIAQIGYYTFIGLTPIGTAIGFYIHQKANKNKYSLQVFKTFEHKISPRIYHLEYLMSPKEKKKIHQKSIHIVVNALKHKYSLSNDKIIHASLQKKSVRQQVHQIQTYLTYRNIFKSFEIISIYIAQHMVNKKLIRKEMKQSFEFMYQKYYNEYVKRNISCTEYVALCKKWL